MRRHLRRELAVLTGALALDRALGEPPAGLHPVVWFGRLAGALTRRARRGAPRAQLAAGAAATALSLGVAFAAGLAGRRAVRHIGGARPPWGRRSAAFLLESWLLKTTLAVRALDDAARVVQRALEKGDLEAGRSGLRSLVSRDTDALDAPLVAAAAIESVAENASDAVVAPALAYLAFGLPGAFVYRGINTLDAMIGYRGEWEWAGKAAARLDDAANFLPARLTAGLLVGAAVLARRSGGPAWRALRRDRGKTASPNAGWPMSATAGALGVALEKVGHYRLGDGGRPPTAGDIGRAVALVHVAVLLGLVLAAGLEGIRHVRDA